MLLGRRLQQKRQVLLIASNTPIENIGEKREQTVREGKHMRTTLIELNKRERMYEEGEMKKTISTNNNRRTT